MRANPERATAQTLPFNLQNAADLSQSFQTAAHHIAPAKHDFYQFQRRTFTGAAVGHQGQAHFNSKLRAGLIGF